MMDFYGEHSSAERSKSWEIDLTNEGGTINGDLLV
jgi:hypothetical protein